jgi:ribosome-associated translation inhibitor RaiA
MGRTPPYRISLFIIFIYMSIINEFSKSHNALENRIDVSIKGISENIHSEHSNDNIINMLNRILHELKELGEAHKNGYTCIKSHEFATKHDLKKMKEEIMSKISEFGKKQNAFIDRMDVSVTNLQNTVQTLLNASGSNSGSNSPEDQAILDAIEVRAEEIAVKLEALDALSNSSGSVPSGSVPSGSQSVSGSVTGTFTGTTVSAIDNAVVAFTNNTINGNVVGTFEGLPEGNSYSGSYSGSYDGTFSDTAGNVFSGSISGSVVVTYSPAV